MKRCEPFFISDKVAKGWGTRAAALLALIYDECQRAAEQDGYAHRNYWVRMSQSEIAHRLGLCRQTVAKIVRTLVAEGLIMVKANANPSGRDRTRWYTLNYRGFSLSGEHFKEWQPRGKDYRVFHGVSAAISSRTGVNAAVVFQFLWHTLHDGMRGPHEVRSGRVWLSHTASSLARWLPFMSRDVVAAALKCLVDKGLLLSCRDQGLVKWAVSDEGFKAMNESPTVSLNLALRDRSVSPQEEEESLAEVRQKLSVQLAYWRLEKRRVFALARTRHNLRR